MWGEEPKLEIVWSRPATRDAPEQHARTASARSIMLLQSKFRRFSCRQSSPRSTAIFFKKAGLASLGTLMPDGSPQVTPVWCDLEGNHVLFNSAKGRQKDRNVRRDPRIALAIIDPENSVPLSRNPRPRRRDHRRWRRRSDQQAGQKYLGCRQVSLRAAQRNPRDLQDQARAHHGDG